MTTKNKGADMTQKYSLICIFMILLLALPASSQQDVFNQDLLSVFPYRSLGPAKQGGRILRIVSHPEQEFTFFIVTASGGIWKTTNNGTTFEPIFDHQNTIATGDMAVSQSDPDILWIGTGTPASGRLSLLGDGVYKSNDGGKTWNHMGLKNTAHIGRITIHPENPDVVYVAAVGYHFSFNPERGLYKTADGGKTWEKSLYISEKVGVVDVVINPKHPRILYAATYDKSRVPWDFKESGPLSRIYKSTDAGENWKKLENGLPSGKIGRIGIAVYPKDPDILYASVENNNLRPPTKTEAERDQQQGRDPEKRRIGREVYRTEDAGETWKKMSPDDLTLWGGKWYGVIYVDPNDDQVVYLPSTPLLRSMDGGQTWGKEGIDNLAQGVHVDHHALWIDPDNSDHIWLGNDGGLAVSYDRGQTWDVFENLPIAQYYAVGVDTEQPYHIYGGTQDNGSIKIPSRSIYGEITADDWESVGGGDGMYNIVDPENSRWLYNEYQLGSLQRVDQKQGFRVRIKPRAEKGESEFRFHWTAPIHLSPHNSRILYMGAQMLLRSLDRGDTWEKISPDLTTNDPEKLKGNIEFCTITTISESPLQAGVIWVGTDDGRVHVTANHGGQWNDVTSPLADAGAPEEYYVSRVFASHFEPGRAYMVKTGFQRDDFRPFVYKTDDFGKTWASINGNMPDGIIYVIAEDHKNPNLLFVGKDFGVFSTIDGGKHWVSMKNNMPTNSVHDLVIHPRENELIAATHGRGIYVTDISPLQEMNDILLNKDVHLFQIQDEILWKDMPRGRIYGQRQFRARNEAAGVKIYYYLKKGLKQEAIITISDLYGHEVRELKAEAKPGLNKVVWNMRAEPEKTAEDRDSRSSRGALVEPGEYVVTVELAGKILSTQCLIKSMPQYHLLK
ncbi:MAG: hypothetical protein GF421_02055 [Candidatus Aminicenantes bacterium]|nr:hypothetical protein [Candidatus Aminicenantes bacterium]